MNLLNFCSMKWVELKMGQLGVLNNPNYKITALLDHMAMITVQSDTRGIFDCKPLGLIWAHFPEVWITNCPCLCCRFVNNMLLNLKAQWISPFCPHPPKQISEHGVWHCQLSGLDLQLVPDQQIMMILDH